MTEILIFIGLGGISCGLAYLLFVLYEVVGDLEELIEVLRER